MSTIATIATLIGEIGVLIGVITIKIAEGVATPEEYSDIIAQRQEWRNQINSLQEGDE